MRKAWKMICLFMAILTISLTGCATVDEGTSSKSEGDIKIAVWKNGSMNESTMNLLKKNFEEKYSQYHVIVEYNGTDVLGSTIELGAKYNDYDLYFSAMPYKDSFAYIEPLNSVLETNNNEIKDKFDEYILQSIVSSDNQYYYLPYVNNWLGLVYNADIIDGTTFPVPKTTNELTMLVVLLQNQNIKPFIHFKTEGYWDYVKFLWEVQYDGLDYYLNTLLKAGDTTGKNPDKGVLLRKDGRYEVMKVLDNIINGETVYSGSNSMDFTDAQIRFFAGKAAMMASGTWLVNEMKATAKDSNMKMMKIPVISSIIDRTEAIESDEELSALIDAIDAAGLNKENIPLSGAGYSVTQGDIDIIYEARNYISSIANDNVVCIPNYATEKEGAKEFVKFLFSEQQIETYAQATHLPLPYKSEITSKLNTTNWNDWEKDLLMLQKISNPLIFMSFEKHPIYTKAGMGNPYSDINVISSMAVPADRKTADQLWGFLESKINTNWNQWLYNLGV